ncbi:hypothetical protein EV368DRAFT_83898 [Lentinula lateritia]|nr:hypothetical protein EV368DRAFT_83898 [Lentinula lateritia]
MSYTSTTMGERELQVLVRRAKATSDKTSTSRRSALKQLVEATRSLNVSLKIFAAKNIPDFFQDFPEAEEDAINAVYDLCEDQMSPVRMAGYNALVQMSRLEKKWVKRNADVLVQLLQSDDPNEVTMVRKALVDHLQLDSRVTLGVLCDQVVPPDDLADPEELAMRNSLRTLVLSFVIGELKKGQLIRYMAPGSEAEDTLVNGLISALPKLGETDTQVILKDILMQLQFLDTPCPRGTTLSQSVLQRAKSALFEDHMNLDPQNGTRSLNKTRPYLDMLSVLFISKRQGNLEDLFNFYTPILGKTVLSSISIEDQLIVLRHFAEALHTCKTNPPSVIRLLNLTPFFFECLSKANLTQVSPQNVCVLLLRGLLLVADNGWIIPFQVLHSVKSLSRIVPSLDQGEDIHELIRSIAPKRPSPISRTASAPSVPSTSGASATLTLPPSSSTVIPAEPYARNEVKPISKVKTLSRKQPLDSDSSSQPTKKVKKGGGEGGGELDTVIPSLLSRMGTSPFLPKMPPHSHPGPVHQQTFPHPRLQRSGSSPSVPMGLKIKGAARKGEFLLSTESQINHAAQRQAPKEQKARDGMNRMLQ